MLDPLANLERPGERPLRQRRLMVGEERLAPNLRRVRLAPRVLVFGLRRPIERLARRLNGLRRIGPGQPDARHRNEELDTEQSIAAGDSVEQPRLRLAKGTLWIAGGEEMTRGKEVSLDNGMHFTRPRGPSANLL